MVNIQIIEYIKEHSAKGESIETIKNNLITGGGWTESDIDEALAALGMSAPASVMPAAVVAEAPVPIAAPMAQPAYAAPAAAVPTPAPVAVAYAGFWVRFAARFIDGLVLIIPIGAINGAIFITNGAPTGTLESYMLIAVNYLISFAYYISMTSGSGSTFGKKAMGIQVLSEDGSKLPFGRVVVRETIGKIISMIIIYIGYIIAGFTSRKQALHDFMGGSIVVYKNPNDGKKANGAVIAIVVCVSFFVVIAIIGILSSIVLASLGTARAKGNAALNDSKVQSALASSTIEAVNYYQEKGSFAGYASNTPAPECSGPLITHVSPDGNVIATFGKSCASSNFYCEALDVTKQPVRPTVGVVPASTMSESKVDCI